MKESKKQAEPKPCTIHVVVCSACGAEDSIHWDKREIGIDDKHGSYLDLAFNYCDQCGNVTDVDLS
jgi:hypothetical protein